MAVFMLEDVAGSVEVVVFPEAFGKHASLVEDDAMLLVRGKFEKDEESARLVATEMLPMAALVERTTREVAIHLAAAPHGGRRSKRSRNCWRGTAAIAACRSSSTSRAHDGRLRVRADVTQRVKPSERLVAEVEQFCGAGSVVLK